MKVILWLSVFQLRELEGSWFSEVLDSGMPPVFWFWLVGFVLVFSDGGRVLQNKTRRV